MHGDPILTPLFTLFHDNSEFVFFSIYICMCLYVFPEGLFNRFHFLFFEKLNARQPVFKFCTDSIR